jgi:hypothetical protein
MSARLQDLPGLRVTQDEKRGSAVFGLDTRLELGGGGEVRGER